MGRQGVLAERQYGNISENVHLKEQEWVWRVTFVCFRGDSLWESEVDRTGSGLCPMVGYGFSDLESSGAATRV